MEVTSSEKTGQLAAALMKVQAAIKPAVKDSTNPHFKTKYADLGSVWDACREALQANGFAVAQTMAPAAAGWVCVETRLLHVSGESLVSSCVLPVVKNDPQAYGSAITYGRRYGLGAMVGVIGEDDDDGNAASTPRQTDAMKHATRSPSAPSKPSGQKAPARPSAAEGMTFPNYGRAKGAPVSGASKQDLEFYRSGAVKSLSDPSKAKWHEKERALIHAIDSELARAHGVQGGPAEDHDEPPPPGDEDAPAPF